MGVYATHGEFDLSTRLLVGPIPFEAAITGGVYKNR